MKKIKLLCFLLFIIHSTYCQNISIDNGCIKFISIPVYEEYCEDLVKQNEISDLALTSNLVSTLSEDSNFVETDSLYSEFLLNILNAEKIFRINNFFIKIDLENQGH